MVISATILVTTEKSVSINIDGNNVENKEGTKNTRINFDSSLSFKGYIQVSVKS